MKTIQIDEPHGYGIDADGRVCFKFGNAILGEKEVPDAVEEVRYVDGPAAHGVDLHWIYSALSAPVTLDLSSDTIINDGSDVVTISSTLDSAADSNRDVILAVDGAEFVKTLSPGEADTEDLTTTKDAGTTISITISGDDIQTATAEIEVVST